MTEFKKLNKVEHIQKSHHIPHPDRKFELGDLVRIRTQTLDDYFKLYRELDVPDDLTREVYETWSWFMNKEGLITGYDAACDDIKHYLVFIEGQDVSFHEDDLISLMN